MKITDPDEIFDRAERLCLAAVEDPSLIPEWKQAQKSADALEHSGWQRRTGMATQHEIVLKHIRNNGSISPHEAILDHGITRLSARIHELKAMGYKFVTVMKTNPTTQKRYARYSLADPLAGMN